MKGKKRNQELDQNAYIRKPILQGRRGSESQRRTWHPMLGLSLLIILGFFFQAVSLGVGGSSPEPDLLGKLDSDCDLHPPIRIIGIGNQDSSPIGFGSPVSGVRSGSGTEDDPYIIEDWCIHLSVDGSSSSSQLDGMHLEHISSHVIIRNNHVINPLPELSNRAGNGIYLEHVDNVTIENNTFKDNYQGIFSRNRAWIPRNVEILDNTVTGSHSWGIHLSGSHGFAVKGNAVTDGASGGIRESGSSFFPSQNNNISDNWITGNEGWDSIWVMKSINTRVENNTMTQNSERGLYIDSSSGVAVRGNEISGHQTGTHVYRSNATEVWENDIHNNTEVGFRVSQSQPSLVSHNMIRGNGIGFEAEESGLINATMNWWGCPEGPIHEDCDGVTGNVTYDPWLTSPTFPPLNESNYDGEREGEVMESPSFPMWLGIVYVVAVLMTVQSMKAPYVA